jgi:4-hydroxyphenylpyruvate dioxygenase-like putative hemolysin
MATGSGTGGNFEAFGKSYHPSAQQADGGLDHVTWWVSNAKQAATYFTVRFGFTPIAYRGLETGSRTVASHVVQHGSIVFVLSSPLVGSGDPEADEMNAHIVKHGDAVRDVAFQVDDAWSVWKSAVMRGAKNHRDPWQLEDEHGVVKMAAVKTYGDTVCLVLAIEDREELTKMQDPHFRFESKLQRCFPPGIQGDRWSRRHCEPAAKRGPRPYRPLRRQPRLGTDGRSVRLVCRNRSRSGFH